MRPLTALADRTAASAVFLTEKFGKTAVILPERSTMLDNFLSWFYEFMTTMLGGVWKIISNLFLGIAQIFGFATYTDQFSRYKNSFSALEWILSILCFILAFAVWAGVIFLIILVVRKYIRFRQSIVGSEDLLEEIADLHRDVLRLTAEKEKLLQMKLEAGGIPYDEIKKILAEDGREDTGVTVPDETADGEKTESDGIRFFRLNAVDEKYSYYVPPEYDKSMNLKQLCDDLRNYACYVSHLYYEIKTIRLMLAGLAATKMILLQGISGTGKTSLPYVMGKYFNNDSTIASVQPSWRDRTELFGYFNEFTKKFNETEVLRRIYESTYNDDINIIILDEMNIARVEYYFAEMLSILEMPDPEEWKIELVSSTWENDPKHLKDGALKIPQNVWYIGTANNDDSTFSVSDKVYDRAMVINLDSKGIPFEPTPTTSKYISYSYVEELYRKAISEHPVSNEILEKVSRLDLYVIEKFRVAFGNRIMKQLKIFLPVYVACGGDEIEALDYLLATKVYRKFENLNVSLIRDEIKGLINFMDVLFGKGKMAECTEFLLRLQRTY